jgi:hypothetical protein
LECVDSQSQVTLDASYGTKVYVALCATFSFDPLSLLQAGGVKALLQDEWIGHGENHSATAGYMVGDEWDMTRGPTACVNGDWQAQINSFPNDGRVKYANFGKGVNFWETDTEAACWVNSVDIPSTDEYWMSDNNVCGFSEAGNKPGVNTANNCHVPANYGWNVQRVRYLVSPRGSKATWSFVEVGCPFRDAGWPCIRTEQIRPAVFHSFIAGARGVTYFIHSFKAGAGNGACGSSFHTLRDCPAARNAVTAVSSEVQSLQAVLDAPYLTSGFTANSNVRAVAKWSSGKFYVIAAAAAYGGPWTGSFSIGCVGDAAATVLGENRSVTVSAGSWSDSFADMNAAHIYRIDGGSNCGLG